MVHPPYNGLQCVSNFLDPQLAKTIVAKYDAKVEIPLLYKASQILNVEMKNAAASRGN